ncbi:unnamed protein product [Diatraea saccharalis]|uniref:Scavenger receptor class B member 1 n=1 Tax=Diatraea saccharalis TaxID=40085 RepID=A0A9N9WAX3_9NEOP|nr:unnamed protein product [Diatraea saccharalis]
MLKSHINKNNTIPIFRRQACRIVPFTYEETVNDRYGFEYYRYLMESSAFNSTSPYACKCNNNCLPDGFVDISNCYYGFPITLSKPHFMDADPQQRSYYEGMHPDPEKHSSILDIEPTMGVPLALSSKVQVNLAVRMSPGNPITKPLKDKIVPMLWLSLYCKEPPPEILSLLRLRLVISPPLIIAIEVLLFVIGFIIGTSGFYRFIRPTYEVVDIVDDKKITVGDRNVISENIAFSEDERSTKEAVSLLTIKEDDMNSIYIDT